ncbi:MAG: nucleoside deaminase [Spirochaetes bacterium]|nr:nucleoside deaminase [Spirochaetota bacterium]
MENNTEKKESYMRVALDQARIARNKGEIPVGAVIVKNGQIIAKACNTNREMNNAVKHAEIICIEKASAVLKNERLTGCALYVTKEPCVMCSGAIVNSRIEKVIIGAEDTKYGACGTVLNVCGNTLLNHIPEIEFGILRDECAALLKDFFRELRKKH